MGDVLRDLTPGGGLLHLDEFRQVFHNQNVSQVPMGGLNCRGGQRHGDFSARQFKLRLAHDHTLAVGTAQEVDDFACLLPTEQELQRGGWLPPGRPQHPLHGAVHLPHLGFLVQSNHPGGNVAQDNLPVAALLFEFTIGMPKLLRRLFDDAAVFQ